MVPTREMLYRGGPLALLCNAMSNQQPVPTRALADAFTARIRQLGISRREFVKRSGLSRQTLHNIEVDGRTVLQNDTYAKLDRALHWSPGTALALACGDDSVLTSNDPAAVEQRANGLRWLIVERLQSLSIEELETLVFQWADNSSEDQLTEG